MPAISAKGITNTDMIDLIIFTIFIFKYISPVILFLFKFVALQVAQY